MRPTTLLSYRAPLAAAAVAFAGSVLHWLTPYVPVKAFFGDTTIVSTSYPELVAFLAAAGCGLVIALIRPTRSLAWASGAAVFLGLLTWVYPIIYLLSKGEGKLISNLIAAFSPWWLPQLTLVALATGTLARARWPRIQRRAA